MNSPRPSPASPEGLNRIPSHDSGALARRVQDEVVLLHTRTETYYSLDEVGARAWDLMDGQRTAADVVDALLAEYDVSRAQVEADLVDLLGDLEHHQLIVWAQRPAR